MTDDGSIPCGEFVLLERVGKGSMAEVWHGRHRYRDHDAAIKIVAESELQSQRERRRFQREVSAHANLHHPGIVDVYDSGQTDEETERASAGRLVRGRPFLAMEPADAGTLREHIPTADWHTCRTLLQQLLDALAFAHARQVIHRDLKPGNVLLFEAESGKLRPKLGDFGMAHATSRSYEGGTEQVSMPSGGTPIYMAPEQFRARWRHFGPWTDLYSLGMLAYEMICGQPPFHSESFFELADAHMSDKRPELDPVFAVPNGAEEWLRRTTAPSPDERFRCAAHAAHALARLEDVSMSTAPTIRDVSIEELVSPEEDTDTNPTHPTFETITETNPSPATGVFAASELETSRRDARADDTDGTVDGPDGPPSPPISTASEPTLRIPRKWTDTPSSHTESRRRIGLNLFGLVEPAFVDRGAERDLLWKAAMNVFRTREPRAVVIEGPTGMGKTRLARWLVRRLHEVGAFFAMETVHQREDTSLEGLRRLIERRFCTWNLGRKKLFELLQEGLANHLGIRPTLVEENEEIVRGMTEFLRPSGPTERSSGPEYYFGSKDEQYALLHRFLRLATFHRPAVVLLDDAGWSHATAQWVLDGLESSQLPVLWLLTHRGPSKKSHANSLPDLLRHHARTIRIDLGPLRPDHQEAMVESLLPLSDELANVVRSKSRGSPLFAVQMLRDWIQAGVIERDTGGFALTGAREESAPENLAGLWRRRIEELLGELPPDIRADGRTGLEVAAALGREVSIADWIEVTAELGLEVTEDLLKQLVRRGLANWTRAGWRFSHQTLVLSLRDESRRRGRWPKIQRACANWVERRVERHTKQSAERLAKHWIEAGEPRRALEPLLDATTLAVRQYDEEALERLLGMHQRQLDKLRGSIADRHQVRNWSDRIRYEIIQGEPDRAADFFDRGLELAEEIGSERAMGEILRAGSILKRHIGQTREAIDLLHQAREYFDELGDDFGRAECFYDQGVAQSLRGNFRRAESDFERAAALFLATGREVRALGAQRWRGAVFIFQDDFERSEKLVGETLERALELGAHTTAVRCYNTLGEIARYRGHWEVAKDHYRTAINEWTKLGRVSYIYRLNLALSEIGAAEYRSANRRLGRIRSELEERSHGEHLFRLRLALTASAAGTNDWSEWDEQFAKAEDELDFVFERSTADRDEPWLAELAADRTREAGEPDRAKKLYDMAARLWRRFGTKHRARKIEKTRL